MNHTYININVCLYVYIYINRRPRWQQKVKVSHELNGGEKLTGERLGGFPLGGIVNSSDAIKASPSHSECKREFNTRNF